MSGENYQNQLVTPHLLWNHRTTVLELCQISDQWVGSLPGRWRHGSRDCLLTNPNIRPAFSKTVRGSVVDTVTFLPGE